MDKISSMQVLETIVTKDEELENAKNYIKSGYKQTNIDPNWSIFYYAVNCCPCGWEELFYNNINIIRNISNKIQKNNHYPYFWEIFNAYHYTRPENIKIVILGQDPYPTEDRMNRPYACGLSFSCRPENFDIPSSLKNIFKELNREYDNYSNYNGDLSYWAMQGVFLLNTTLTVIPHDTKIPHKGLWNGFTERTLEFVCNKVKGCIFLLWGRKAQEYEGKLTNEARVFKTSHPSGYSATKGFIGCNHFKEANAILVKDGKTPIDWNIPFKS